MKEELPNIPPRLAGYTDLMVTGDPRNVKIATEIYAKTIAGTALRFTSRSTKGIAASDGTGLRNR